MFGIAQKTLCHIEILSGSKAGHSDGVERECQKGDSMRFVFLEPPDAFGQNREGSCVSPFRVL